MDWNSHHASLLGIQKDVRHYVDGRTRKLVTYMALREAGEKHHDNAGGSGSRKFYQRWLLTILCRLKRDTTKKPGTTQRCWESYRKFHPAWSW